MENLRNFDSSSGKQMVLINCQVLLIIELIKKDNLFRTLNMLHKEDFNKQFRMHPREL